MSNKETPVFIDPSLSARKFYGIAADSTPSEQSPSSETFIKGTAPVWWADLAKLPPEIKASLNEKPEPSKLPDDFLPVQKEYIKRFGFENYCNLRRSIDSRHRKGICLDVGAAVTEAVAEMQSLLAEPIDRIDPLADVLSKIIRRIVREEIAAVSATDHKP